MSVNTVGPMRCSCIKLKYIVNISFYDYSRTVIDTTSSTLSSTASSQDSLHKHQKKKGIKSSIGRLFSKKEKQKQKGALGRDMPAGNYSFPILKLTLSGLFFIRIFNYF
jgi:hypothetical protein